MGNEENKDEVIEETPEDSNEEAPEDSNEEAPTEETPETTPEEGEDEKKNSVTVSWRGNTREYSEEVHGENFRELAKSFAEKMEGEVE